MSTTRKGAYLASSDASLIQSCMAGDELAWATLERRHERLIMAVAVRAIDERRHGALEELPGAVSEVTRHLRREDAKALRDWNHQSTFGPFLSVVARQVTSRYLQDVTPPATDLTTLPSRAALFLDEIITIASAREVSATLERLPPHIVSLVRLRLRDADDPAIASILGMTPGTALSRLTRVASRLAELTDVDYDDAFLAWRILLKVVPIHERVHAAIHAEDSERFRQAGEMAAGMWRAMRERALKLLHPRTGECLLDTQVAAFIDGSLRGEERVATERHLSNCARCIDTVASTRLDLLAVEALPPLSDLITPVAVSAACIFTKRFRAGEIMAEKAKGQEFLRAKSLVRLARVGQSLAVKEGAAYPAEPSGVIRTRAPSALNAPIASLEALVADNLHSSFRAIDDDLAKETIGARLRLLTLAAGEDPEPGRTLATELESRARSDPGLMTDIEAVLALPDRRRLPREILIERVQDCIPAAIRFVMSAW